MSPLPHHLLPDTASVLADGSLSVGGVPLLDLASQYGTPLFVYDEQHLRNRCREAVESFGNDSVVYATKAFLCKAMARLAHEEGLMLDVATAGELYVACSDVAHARVVSELNRFVSLEIRFHLVPPSDFHALTTTCLPSRD